MKVLLVGLGGFAGSVARYVVGGVVQDLGGGTFPLGTLAVNVLGCAALGLLAELADARGFLAPEARALVVVGALGGFTTFSAFGGETVNLLRDRDWLLALANVLANVVLGIAAVWLGRLAAHAVWR